MTDAPGEVVKVIGTAGTSSPVRRRKLILAFVVLVILASISILRMRRGPRALPATSRVVASIKDWSVPHPGINVGFGYTWLDKNTIMAALRQPSGRPGAVFEINTTKGTTAPRKDLDYLAAMHDYPGGYSFTPDCKMSLLWHYQTGNFNETTPIEVTDVSSHRVWRFAHRFGADAVWSDRGNEFVEVETLRDGRVGIRVAITNCNLGPGFGITRTIDLPTHDDIFGATAVAGGKLTIGYQPAGNENILSDEYQITSIVLDGADQHPTTRRFQLPFYGTVTSEAISQDGTRLAFVEERRTFTLAQRLRSITPWLHDDIFAPHHYEESVWICDVDGSHMKELGYSREGGSSSEGQTSDGFSSPIEDIRWLPGDSAVSFVADSNLRTVNVD